MSFIKDKKTGYLVTPARVNCGMDRVGGFHREPGRRTAFESPAGEPVDLTKDVEMAGAVRNAGAGGISSACPLKANFIG
jgi:hypothetical protein